MNAQKNSKTYADTLQEARRLCLLRTLTDAPAYTANDEMLAAMCYSVGIASTRAQVVDDMRWLDANGLCRVEALGEGVHVALLTERGLDVARGLATVRGVRKPSPRQTARHMRLTCPR